MKNISTAESYAPSPHYVEQCKAEIAIALPSTNFNVTLPVESLKISDVARGHFDLYLKRAEEALSHDACLRQLEYCAGFVGGLTIGNSISINDHVQLWSEIDAVRDQSFSRWISGERK